MAASDAKAIPVKNAAYRVTFPILDADGDLVTGAASLDSEVSIDGGTFADCTNEATEIATSSGMYYLDLTSGEMNGDTIAIIVKTGTAGAKTTPIVLYTAARSINDLAYPTTTGRSIDVTATGEVGIDWANIGGPTTVQNLSGTTVKDATDVNTDTDTLLSRLGAPSDLGSGATVSANLVDIEGQTDDIGAAGAGLTAVPWNAAWDAEVESEANDALIAQNLDHLVKSAVDTDFATTVQLNSVIGHLADNGTSATFDRTTDSLEAIYDKEIDIETDTQNIQSRLPTTLTGGNIKADVQRILTLVPGDYLDQILNAWVSLMVRKDAGVNADFITQYAMINQNNGSGAGTYNNTTDALEANRDNIGTNGAALSLAKTTNITGFNDLSAAQVNTEADTALADVGVTTTVTGRIDAAISTRATPAQVNAEVVDALATDTYAEPGQGTPAATTTLAAKINYLYKTWRNKKTSDGSTTKLYADDGTTVDQKQTTSESGGTVTKAEWETGP